MQSMITVTKYTDVITALQQVQEEEQTFLQLLARNGGQNK